MIPFLVILAATCPTIQEGKSFGKNVRPSSVEFNVNDILSEENQDQFLDGKDAKILLESSPDTSEQEILVLSSQGDTEENDFLDHGDAITSEPEKYVNSAPDVEAKEIKTCRISFERQRFETERELRIQVKEIPTVMQEVKVCQGHKETIKIPQDEGSNTAKKRKEEELEQDPLVDIYSVTIEKGSLIHRDTLNVTYRHVEGCSSCNNFSINIKTLKESTKRIATEEWVYHGESLENLVKAGSRITGRTCLDAETTKTIDDLQISRPCWFEKVQLERKNIVEDSCKPLMAKSHQLLSKKIVPSDINGTETWEYTYEIYPNLEEPNDESAPIQGDSEDDWDEETVENDSFNSAGSALTVLNEIQKEGRKNGGTSPEKLEIFSGKKAECSKNELENLAYNCCFRNAGLAIDLALTKCTADELSLQEAQEKGITHYVGFFYNTYAGITTSKTHSFCVFPSKIARIFQEQARKQLGIPWGDGKHPNCRGILMSELSDVNFSKLDFSELDLTPSDTPSMEQRKKEIEQSIKSKLAGVQ